MISKYKLYIPISLVAVMMLTGAKNAHIDDHFVIRNVPIFETAENADKARKVAINSGRKQAFKMLLTSLKLPLNHPELQTITNQELAGLTKWFEVTEEKITPNSYEARFTIAFQSDYTTTLLHQKGLRLIDETLPKLLIIPLLQKEQKFLLWGEDNIWAKAWSHVSKETIATPMMLAMGDLEDLQMLGVLDVISGNNAGIKELASKYEADIVLIAEAHEQNNTLDIVLRWFGSGFVPEHQQRYRNSKRIDRDRFFYQAAKNLLPVITEHLQKTKAVTTDTRLSVSAYPADLPEWLDLKHRIENSGPVDLLSVKEVTTEKILFEIIYKGELALMLSDLYNNGVSLSERDEGWIAGHVSND